LLFNIQVYRKNSIREKLTVERKIFKELFTTKKTSMII